MALTRYHDSRLVMGLNSSHCIRAETVEEGWFFLHSGVTSFSRPKNTICIRKTDQDEVFGKSHHQAISVKSQ